MEWLVEERRGGDGEADGEEDADQWRTELRLELPRLGSVHARIGLNGDRLNLSITTPEESVRDEMRRALPQLTKGLEAAGLRPGGMSVESGHAG
jgi:flagellar hook-length control protein FliK